MTAPKKRIVLIGEPDHATTELYQRTLRSAFTVIAAADEATIVRLLHRRHIDALVLEPMLLVWQGWQRLIPISRLCAEKGIPLVVCSTLDERRRGFELGATLYLIKPTLPTTLLHAVRQVSEGRGKPKLTPPAICNASFTRKRISDITKHKE